MTKIALITGANRGIGFETARQLGKMDYTVLIGARDSVRGQEAAATLRDEGIQAKFLLVDPTDSNSVQDAAKIVASEFGVLDVLINNAGVLLSGDQAQPSEVETSILKETFESTLR